jgi:uncharacterized iron-regulated membrane protein
MNKRLRTIARSTHIWIGLPLGLLFCLMGLSGSIILYRDAIEATLRPAWKAASGLRPASVLAEADRDMRRRWPAAAPSRISFPRAAGEPYEYQIRVGERAVHAYFDPATGEMLGTFETPWLDWVAGFHQNLLLPPSGRQLVGVIGIGLFLSSVSGLVIWFLRNRSWRNSFRIAWGASWNRLSFDLHRTIGFTANIFLLILSFTGICLGFPDTFRGLSEIVTGSSGARAARITVPPSAMRQSLDSYIRAAVFALPDSIVRELRFPQSADRPVVVRLWRRGDYREEGTNLVSLDPATARVIAVDTPQNWSPARKLASAPAPIHYAEWGGPVVKALWAMAGITPSILFVSGLWFWISGYRARTKTVKQAERPGVLAAR